MTSKMNAQEQVKSALVLIETQNEWMHKDGKLNKGLVKDKEMMQTSISNIEKALEYGRKYLEEYAGAQNLESWIVE